MEIGKHIFWRWLGWTLGGALFGFCAGALIGGMHGAVYAVAFYTSRWGNGLRAENAVTGLMFGALHGVWEGTVIGAIAFCLASLLCLQNPRLLTVDHFKNTMRAALQLSAIGAVAGAMTFMAVAFLRTYSDANSTKLAVGQGYYLGCQVGFNLGLLCGVLLPLWKKDFRLWHKASDFERPQNAPST